MGNIRTAGSFKIYVVTVRGCPKCHQARKILGGYKDIEWLSDFWSGKRKNLIDYFNLEIAPSFIIVNEVAPDKFWANTVRVTNNILEVKKFLEENKDKGE